MANGKIVSTSLEKIEDEDMDEILGQLRDNADRISESEKDVLVGPMECEETISKKTVETGRSGAH